MFPLVLLDDGAGCAGVLKHGFDVYCNPCYFPSLSPVVMPWAAMLGLWELATKCGSMHEGRKAGPAELITAWQQPGPAAMFL